MDAAAESRSPLELFAAVREDNDRVVKCVAPMVRYSKLPFRLLCRRWGADVAFTPMLIAKEFVTSERARHMEFVSNAADRPLVVQFAASSAAEFARAAQLVMPYCDGVDLNCGCPQRWAIADGIGSALLRHPELVQDMVQQATEATGARLPVSIKIRLDPHDLRQTVELAQRAERVGVAWLTVHGRTPRQRSSAPVDYDAIKLVCDSVGVPVVANGDIDSLATAVDVRRRTGALGVMTARGILSNPAMFAGYETTPAACVRDWIDICVSLGDLAPGTEYLQRHLMMCAFNTHSRPEKLEFNSLRSTAAVLDFMHRRGVLRPDGPPAARPATTGSSSSAESIPTTLPDTAIR